MTYYSMGKPVVEWMSGLAQSLTFVVTQDCNLRCKYCYMVGKNSENKMSFHVAKKAIDYFLDNSEYFIAKAVILDFIGGEPLLEIDLIDQITDYFKIEAYKKNHRWFDMYRINIATNGLLYSSEKVQKFLEKNLNKVSIGISIDGTKSKHDLQRVYPNGEGSYDDVLNNVQLWKKQFPECITKVTIGHEDLKYLKESITHLWDIGINTVPANIVFENVWEDGDEEIYYEQLISLADYIIEHDLWKEYNTTLFDENIGFPLKEQDLKNTSCGSGKMIAIDAEGRFYPCVRFMDYSLENHKGISTGNIDDGFDFERARPFFSLDIPVQSDEECINCNVAYGCDWCQGLNYDCSKTGTIFNRNRNICKMHKVRVRANDYYWNKLEKERGIGRSTYKSRKNNLFIMLADNCVSHCNYETPKNEGLKIGNKSLQLISNFVKENFYTPVILHSEDKELSKLAMEKFQYTNIINIFPYKSNELFNSSKDIICIEWKDLEIEKDFAKKTCILSIQKNELSNLSVIVEKALTQFKRINIKYVFNLCNEDLALYKVQLNIIVKILLEYYENNDSRHINVITDDLFYHKDNGCGFGVNNFAIGPNGNVYLCPAFYYDDKDNVLGDIWEEDLSELMDKSIYNREPLCEKCDIKHCNKCIYINRKITGEYNIPSSIQCKIALYEKTATYNLYKHLEEKGLIKNIMNTITYPSIEDPIQSLNLGSNKNFNYYAKVFAQGGE